MVQAEPPLAVGTFQGVIGHKVGRKGDEVRCRYLGMMLDWLLYTFVTPVFLVYVVVTNADQLGHIASCTASATRPGR